MPFTPEQERAQTIRDAFDMQARRISGNPRINDEDELRQVARLYLATEAQLEALHREQEGDKTQRRHALEAQLFDNIGEGERAQVDSINYSDLNGSSTLFRLYARARHDGNTALARAAVNKAFEINDTDSLDQIVNDGSADAPAVRELWSLITNDTTNDPGNWSFEPTVPPVLRGYNHLQISVIAARDDTAIGTKA